MDPLRVLHIVFSLDPGGTEGVLTRVACGLDPQHFQIHVCTLNRRGAYADRLPDPANVVNLAKPPGLSWRTVIRLRQAVRRIDPHVVHTHNLGPLFYAVPALCLMRRYPILHGLHGQLVDADMTPKYLLLRKFLYKRATLVHTVSDGLRQQLIDVGFPSAQITVLRNGVDTDVFAPAAHKPDARRKIGLPPSGMVVGMVGRLSPNKRHAMALEALAQTRNVQSDLHLLVVGDGPQREFLHQAAQDLNLEKVVTFAGYHPDPLPFYQAMDLLVHPSRQEGLSNAILEAMACEVPVLTHESCGAAEAIDSGNTGWIESLNSADDLASHLVRIASKRKDVKRKGRMARRVMVESFSFPAMVNRYAALYCKVARTRGVGGYDKQ